MAVNEVLRYLLFGLVFFALLLAGIVNNSDLLCYLSVVVLAPWLLGLLIGVIVKLKERDGRERGFEP